MSDTDASSTPANTLQSADNKRPGRKPYKKLTLIDHVLICRAAANQPGISKARLAKQLNLDVRSVQKALKYNDITPLDLLQAAERKAVNGWVKAVPIAAGKGDHRPSRDLLLYSGAIEPLQANQGSTVTIVFGAAVLPGAREQSAQRESGQQIIDVSGAQLGNVDET